MNKKIIIIIIGAIILIALTFAFLGNSNQDNQLLENELLDEETERDFFEQNNQESGGDNIEGQIIESENGQDELKSGYYKPYSEENLDLVETEKIVLFFHATWCPSCRALNQDVENNIGSIPSELTILKVDYDKETELKRKYGVTTQHTLVQIDESGNLLKKWSGGSRLETVISQIQ